MKPSILIIDDERAICASLSLVLETDYAVSAVTDADQGLRLMEEQNFGLVLLDLKIGDRDGIEVLKQIKSHDPSVAVIIMTAYGSIRSSVEAMKNGAFSYLSKPLDVEELLIFIRQALEFRHLNEQVQYLSRELQSRYSYGEMIGKSPAMQRVYQMIEKVKDVGASVTITGESGTGKELVARAIHFQSKRRDEKFVDVNCAAIPEGLLEEEFFGHKKGSFTGAIQDKKGKFEMADGGTLFLDEVGDMPLNLQGKLLRVLEQKEFTPIGGSEPRRIDVRVISATNQDLRSMVKKGLFRGDLFYRLNIVEIKLPPLRERTQDIPLLARHFLSKYSADQGKAVQGIDQEAERMLVSYQYPGNVRELANALEYGVILSGGETIRAGDLPLLIQEECGGRRLANASGPGSTLEEQLAGLSIAQVERIAIEAALKRNGGRQKVTAEELGISERGLRNKIKDYDLNIRN